MFYGHNPLNSVITYLSILAGSVVSITGDTYNITVRAGATVDYTCITYI